MKVFDKETKTHVRFLCRIVLDFGQVSDTCVCVCVFLIFIFKCVFHSSDLFLKPELVPAS